MKRACFDWHNTGMILAIYGAFYIWAILFTGFSFHIPIGSKFWKFCKAFFFLLVFLFSTVSTHLLYLWFEKLILLELALLKPILLGKIFVKFRAWAQEIVFLALLAHGLPALCCFIKRKNSAFVINSLSNWHYP